MPFAINVFKPPLPIVSYSFGHLQPQWRFLHINFLLTVVSGVSLFFSHSPDFSFTEDIHLLFCLQKEISAQLSQPSALSA